MATNQLAIRQQQALTTTGANEWETLLSQARVLLQSGFLPVAIKTESQCAAIIMQGRALNIDPMTALQTINVIQGKPTVSPQLMMALCNRTGELEDMKCLDDGNKCTVTLKRRGRAPFTTSFSMEEAGAMGLSGKDNWKKQAKTMRQWRAIAAAARVVFPDAILGLYLHDEMGADTNEEGEIIAPLQTADIHQLAPTPAIDIQAPLPSQQKKSPVTRKQKMILKIEDLLGQEQEEFGDFEMENDAPFLEMSEKELEEMGKSVAARLEEKRAQAAQE